MIEVIAIIKVVTKNFLSKGIFTKAITIGAITQESIEASETYLLNNNIITKQIKVIIAVGQ